MRMLIDLTAEKTNKHNITIDASQSKYLSCELIGCGRRSRTFIFEFKARRVAGYTIPQKEFRGTGIRTQNLALIWR